jgi:hypothetical protein
LHEVEPIVNAEIVKSDPVDEVAHDDDDVEINGEQDADADVDR